MSQIDLSLKQHSLALQNIIRERITKENNISFAQFMHMALYQPGYGYYSSGTQKFGKDGDFVTSPELGDLFAKCVAKQLQQVIDKISTPIILELGAGTGQFCCDCLLELDYLTALPDKYYILEVSADLQQRQKEKIQTLPQHLQSIVVWIEQPLTKKFNGIIFANEVIDALPVEVFKVGKQHLKQYQQMQVTWDDDFQPIWQPMPANLATQLKDKNLDLADGYVSEFIPNLSAWLHSISANLQQGIMLFVDYGYERDAYYHPQRHQGTLVCFSQHQANFDYFHNVGMQDVTAFVDFTAVATAGDDCGFDIDGYTTQAHFLLSLGIEQLLGDSDSDNNYTEYYKQATQMKKLVMPNEMGEKFKVIALSKKFDDELLGFALTNHLHLL
ncbi:MAG: SAM-dependent methyltransferase [Proteobacteria bacterium]|nr:SAM-dependent methyltransferase [Pseudomonadota bacterium]